MVDRPRAVALLEALRAALVDLERYASTVDLERLRRDPDTQNMVLFAIYRAAQSCIDLAHHIVADEGLRVPTGYRAVFDSLREAGWIDDALAARLAGWAGLRNVIAHGYVRIDFDRIHAALGERADLVSFATALAQRLTP